MIVIALAAAMIGQSPKISLSTGGAPVEVILRELSEKSGVHLHAADRVRGEILIVEAKDVSFDDVMARIAEADGAEWRPDGEGYELTRSTKLLDSQISAELASKTASVAKGLSEHLATALAPLTGPHPNYDIGGRLAWRAMQALGPNVLARVRNGTRTVYSTDPTPVQKRWPGNFQPLVQAYLSEYRAAPGESDENGNVAKGPQVPVARALVALTSSMFEGLTTHVYLFDAKGMLLEDGSASMMPPELEVLEKSTDPNAPKAAGIPLELSDTAKEFLELAKSSMAQKPVALSPAMISRILDPAKYDPLGLFVADGLRAVAKNGSRSMVASVPDLCFLTGLFLGNGVVSEEAFRHWIEANSEIDESHAGWMVVRPKYPVDTRELRVDREKMGAFYRTAWKNGGVRLGELGAYIATQPRRYVETISLFYAFFCMPEIAHMFEPDGLGAIRAYGMLTEDQRAQLDGGKPVPFGALSPAAREELSDWVYNSRAYGFGSREYDKQYVDPTDAFPNGLSAPCELTANPSVQDAVIPLYASGAVSLDGSPLSANALGFELGRTDVGEQRIKGSMTSFLLGKEVRLAINFESPRLTLRSDLRETRFNRGGKSLTLGELPATFQDEVVRSRAEYAKMRADEEQKKSPPPPR